VAAVTSLYVHVPFCPTICPYCDFHVVRRTPGAVEAYLDRLAAEARALAGRVGPLTTLYYGGGTPSYLRLHELRRLLDLGLPLAPGAEVTLEANPGTLNAERLALLKERGVNRLSIGVQSFQDPVLKALGRAHRAKGAYRAVELALAHGFRVSIDLILGLPGQDVARDLAEAARLGVGHVSAYTLLVEPGTPFFLMGLKEDPDREAEALETARWVLGEAGFFRYEVSNFARPGEEARHNQVYWRMGFWAAIGPGASAHLPASAPGHYAERKTNPPLFRWLAGEPPRVEPISPKEHVKEALMMGLRTREGVDVTALEARTGLLLWPRLAPAASRLEERGLLTVKGRRLLPTEAGLDLAHSVVSSLWEALS